MSNAERVIIIIAIDARIASAAFIANGCSSAADKAARLMAPFRISGILTEHAECCRVARTGNRNRERRRYPDFPYLMRRRSKEIPPLSNSASGRGRRTHRRG